MEILCKREELLKGIQAVQSIASAKSFTIPVLSNILLDVKPELAKLLYKLTMIATDLEVGIKYPVRVEVVKEGSITIPARTFSDVIRECPSEEIRIKVDEKNRIQINSGQAVFKLAGLPKDDYPVLPEFKANQECIEFFIDRELLKKMIGKTIFSVSRDETRYVLCGVCLSIHTGKVTMVSTDGRRLSVISENVNADNVKNYDKNKKVIIPTKAVNELNKILMQVDEDKVKKGDRVKINIGENQISFEISPNNTILISRLIEGNFPEYENIIPKKSSLKVKIKTQDLLQATRRVAILTTDRSLSVKYLLEKDKLTISTATEGLGEAQDIVGIGSEGRRFETAYNPQFLVDVLRNIDCNEVYLELTEPLNPCLIRPVSGEDYISIIMPMRI